MNMNAETEQSSKDSVFREPKAKAEVREVKQEPRSTETPSIPRDTTEPTPKELNALGREPYLIELFEAKEVYSHFDVESQSKDIDSFIISELDRRNLEDTRDNYKKVLDELYKNVKATDSVYINLEGLLEWVNIQKKLVEAMKEKEAFEKKSPGEMSSKELKKFIEGK